MTKPKIETTITRDNSLIDFQAWHKGYTTGMKKWLGWSYSDTVFYIHDGYGEIMRPPKEHLIYFRDKIASKIDSNPAWFKTAADDFNKLTSEIFKFYKTFKNKVDKFSGIEVLSVYEQYANYISRVVGAYITMHWLPIWFENDDVNKAKYRKEIGIATTYRKKSERLFPDGEELMNKILSKFSKEAGIDDQLTRVLSAKELSDYFTKNITPDKNILSKRAKGFVYSKKGIILTDNTEKNLKKIFDQIGYDLVVKARAEIKEIKGQSACSGVAKGRVRVIISKRDIGKLKNGEVLVTAMTTPEYLPAMKKSIAFLTDEGGITCHAAIIARELNKPCVIGTKIATKVLHDGDLVEVDADKGIVKIIR